MRTIQRETGLANSRGLFVLTLLSAAAAGFDDTSRSVPIRIVEARAVLAREDSGRALELLADAVRVATTLEDESLARCARVEALTLVQLTKDAAEDIARLTAIAESGAMSRADTRRTALCVATWHRVVADQTDAPVAHHREREFAALEIVSSNSASVAERAEAFELRSYAHTLAGRFDAAREDLAAASALHQEQGDATGEARCLRRGAFTEYRAGDPSRAIALLDANRLAISRLQKGEADLTESRTHEYLRTLAQLEIGDLDAAEFAAARFIASSAALLQGLPWGHVMRTHRLSSPAVASMVGALMRHLARRPGDEARVFSIASALAESAKARLLRVAMGNPLALDHGATLAPRAIPAGVAVLRFLDANDDFTGAHSLALFVERDGERRVFDLGDAARLLASIEEWRTPNEAAWSETASAYAARTEPLARSLLKDVLDWTRPEDGAVPVRRLVVLADGVLARIPLEALVAFRAPDESDYSKLDYLVRHVAIVHLPSYAVFDAVQPPSTNDRVIAVLDPGRTLDRSDLRHAPLEKKALEASHEAVFALEGAAATKGALFEAIAKHRSGWLHLACHADADPSFRHTARLALAADPDAAGSAADSTLSALEIFTLPLEPGTRVVLSACSTASGDHVRGEGVLGVWRAFLAAGASAVVSTVRDVDDRSAAAWMTSFHAECRNQASLAEASRRASLAWIEGRARPRFPRGARISDPAHPLLWGNYICVGDDGGPLPQRRAR